MPKKTLFISAALTAFTLVTVVGVVGAYQKASVAAAPTESTAVAVAAVSTPTFLPTATEEVMVALTPQEAAMVAANYMEQTDLYSVESVVWEGVDAYKVVFSSGDIVYVGIYGEVLGVEEPPVVYVNNKNNNNSNNNVANHNSNDNRGEREEHDDD